MTHLLAFALGYCAAVYSARALDYIKAKVREAFSANPWGK